MNSDREGIDDSRPCGCIQDCDCLGPNLERGSGKAGEQAARVLDTAATGAKSAQKEKAFAALSSMRSAPWMQIGDLVQRLRRFGHSEQWALDMAREWMKEHSKLVKS